MIGSSMPCSVANQIVINPRILPNYRNSRIVATWIKVHVNYHPISGRVDGSISRSSPYYYIDTDLTSSSFLRTVGQGSSILSSVKHVMTHTCLKISASSAANSNKWLESFSNWRNVGVISQLASATMIEFLPLPVIGKPNIISTGNWLPLPVH